MHVAQKSAPNGVKWIERRVVRAPRPASSSAATTSGCASSTW
jgi:hypothetical protein